MKLAVVGTGTIVKKFLYAVPKTAFFQCVAVCSRQQESGTCFIESCRDLEGLDTGAMQVYTDYTAMLAEPEIELVYIALPNSLHYSYAKQALLAGKHVICEKPFTVEAKETEELIAIAKERKQFLFEAITTRNLPNYEIVKKALPKLGQIRMIQCNFSQPAFCHRAVWQTGTPFLSSQPGTERNRSVWGGCIRLRRLPGGMRGSKGFRQPGFCLNSR